MPEQAPTEEIVTGADSEPGKKEPRRSASPDLMLLADVMDYTTLSKAVLYRLMKREEFPAPVHLAPNRRAWRTVEVREWVDNRVAA
ncbi:MAG: AlpA family phage regulatory protein [Porphyrobacter sp.]|nr:AlpA family phage regulatory protein [Porphyrobacter sp.]